MSFLKQHQNKPEQGTLNEFERAVYDRVNEKFSQGAYAFVTKAQVKAVFWVISELLCVRVVKAYKDSKALKEDIGLWTIFGFGKLFVRLWKVSSTGYKPCARFRLSNQLRERLKEAGVNKSREPIS